MAVFQAALAILIVAHLFSLLSSTFRVVNRYSRDSLWLDDGFSAVSSCGGMFVLGTLLAIIFHAPTLRPLEYHLALGGCFFVMWAAKASLAMTMERLLHHTYWPNLLPVFWLLSCALVGVGIAYTLATVLSCIMGQNCPDNRPCFCNIETNLVLYALITNAITDTCVVGLNVWIFSLKRLKNHAARKWIASVGLSCSTCIFAVHISTWASYRASASSNHMLLLCLADGVAVVSLLCSDMPAVTGILSGQHSVTGGVLGAPLDAIEESTSSTSFARNRRMHVNH